MTPAPVELPTWSRARWLVTIALVLVFQVALILALERSVPAARYKGPAAPLVHFRENVRLDKMLVGDPTIFVLPHPQGFSGAAWLNLPRFPDFQSADWTEPLRLLTFNPASLVAKFEQPAPASSLPRFETVSQLQPGQSQPVLYASESPALKSSLQIEGNLAGRRLLAALSLPVWESSELLGGSRVQVLVDAQGRVVSAVLLSPVSAVAKQQEADAAALELAKTALFEPAPRGTLNLGALVFDWLTVPVSGTNRPVEIP